MMRACAVFALPLAAALFAPSRIWSAAPDFNRDIRPILSGRCYKCHGPDGGSREADLRFDLREAAIRELDSGSRAIVPDHPEDSDLLARARTSDPDLRMPPPSEGPPLTAAEIDLLERWIASGANYSIHWSYVAPVKSTPPKVSHPEWTRNEIDRFVAAVLDREGLSPQEEAAKPALLRRLTLDLTGLPPTLEELEAFVADDSAEAYERVVDRLLSSPAYGERWGRVWLDLARYADSAGYADDPPRVIWRYRDWVVDALNSGMSFDQFTVDQLAGDLLPNPSESQLIATGFHRNTMTNSEGGTDDEEFRNAAIVDRVNTTAQVWMASTMMCAQCHTHKYDPITQEEYYRFFAILNQTADADRRDETPVLEVFSAEQEARKVALQSQIDTLTKSLDESRGASSPDPIDQTPVAARFVRIDLPGKDKILSLAEVQVFKGENNLATGKSATQSSVAYGGSPERANDGETNGDFYEANSTTHTNTEEAPWWEVDLGEEQAIDRVVLWNRTDGDIGGRLNGCQITVFDASRRPRWVHTVAEAAPKDGSYAVPTNVKDFSEDDRRDLQASLDENSPERKMLRDQLRSVKKELASIAPITTPIMKELSPENHRTTRIQIRGNFLDLGDKVSPGVPAVFPPIAAEAPNRLDVAKWLVDRNHPLTARVFVNRLWEQLFGIGIVETSEEFGMQGDLPTHPELLDWLAVEFMDRGWDMKEMLRLIVTSAAYRQSSNATEEAMQNDPNNRMLARGPRFRLEAELVRDQALFVAGLLSEKMHGPSVKPPRPKLGLTAAFGGSTDWDASAGEDRYRRGIYTYWQRSIPYPSMDTFDAPSREVCTVRRTRTNTPLQALVTMNDPVYVEAAQGFARRLLRESPGSGEEATRARIEHAYHLCLTRDATPGEVDVLRRTVDQAIAIYRMQPDEAVKLATDPIGPLPEGVDPAEAAGWTVFANVLLNLDETLTRR